VWWRSGARKSRDKKVFFGILKIKMCSPGGTPAPHGPPIAPRRTGRERGRDSGGEWEGQMGGGRREGREGNRGERREGKGMFVPMLCANGSLLAAIGAEKFAFV